MSAHRRLTVVFTVASVLAAGVWAAVLPELISASTALWLTLGIGLCGVVGARFNRHAALPDSVKLH